VRQLSAASALKIARKYVSASRHAPLPPTDASLLSFISLIAALVLARLSGSTWVNKGGENKYYDAVGWKEKVDVVRDEMKEVLGDDESFVDSGGNYEANSTSEAQDDESQNDAQSLKADDSVVSEITSLKSEWIDVEVEGKKMLQNIVTQEFKEAN